MGRRFSIDQILGGALGREIGPELGSMYLLTDGGDGGAGSGAGDGGKAGSGSGDGTAAGNGDGGKGGAEGGDQAGGSADGHPAGSKEAILGELVTERRKRQAAEAETTRLKGLEQELTTLRQSSMSEQERAVAQARQEARDEAIQEVVLDRAQDRIRALAGGKLQDPEDAVAHLKAADYVSGSNVDSDRIIQAIEQLLKDKPYLKASGTRASGDADQGAGGSGGSTQSNDMDSLLRAAVTGR